MLYLSRIQLLNFKNHESLDLELSSNVNAIVGKNGMGKTNIQTFSRRQLILTYLPNHDNLCHNYSKLKVILLFVESNLRPQNLPIFH